MKGLNKFQRGILRAMRPHIVSLLEDREKARAFAHVLTNYLLDLPGPKYLNGERSPSYIHTSKIFYGFVEISQSLETLEDIRFLVGRPPHESEIPGDRYLQIHAEAYLQQMYVLRERLRKFVALAEREYKDDTRCRERCTRARAILAVLDDAFSNVLRVRHRHTHEERFSDEGISRLRSIGLQVGSDNKKVAGLMRALYRAEYTKVRKKWKKTISSNNRTLRRILDAFFEELQPLVFDSKTGRVRFPAKLAPN